MGFRTIRSGWQADRYLIAGHIGKAGHHHHGHCGRRLLDCFSHLIPVHLRHGTVRHDQIESAASELLESFFSVRRRFHKMSLVPQVFRLDFPHLSFVFDNQYTKLSQREPRSPRLRRLSDSRPAGSR